MQQDTALIMTDAIRIANLIFVERDRLEDELNICTTINSINAQLVEASDSTISKLESKVANLNAIVSHKDDIIKLEVDKIEALKQKHKKEKVAIIGGGGIIILLLLLL